MFIKVSQSDSDLANYFTVSGLPKYGSLTKCGSISPHSNKQTTSKVFTITMTKRTLFK